MITIASVLFELNTHKFESLINAGARQVGTQTRMMLREESILLSTGASHTYKASCWKWSPAAARLCTVDHGAGKECVLWKCVAATLVKVFGAQATQFLAQQHEGYPHKKLYEKLLEEMNR